MFGRIVGEVIDADTKGGVCIFRRGRDDDPLGARLEVSRAFFFVRKNTGALMNDVDFFGRPRELGRIFFGEHLDRVVADMECITFDPNGLSEVLSEGGRERSRT